MYILVCISSVASHVAYLANDALYFIDYILDTIAPDLCNTNMATLLPYLLQHHLTHDEEHHLGSMLYSSVIKSQKLLSYLRGIRKGYGSLQKFCAV